MKGIGYFHHFPKHFLRPEIDQSRDTRKPEEVNLGNISSLALKPAAPAIGKGPEHAQRIIISGDIY